MEELKVDKPLGIESIANYEGNWSEVLFSRLQNPVIRQQLIALLFQLQSKDAKYKTEEEIAMELEENLTLAMSKTDISFQDPVRPPNANSINLLWENPSTGKKLNPRQLSMIEAHEKGHKIRSFRSLTSWKYFSSGFDTSKIIFTPEDFEKYKKASRRKGKVSQEEFKIGYINYLFSGNEIIERMSQLKNYFGMKGSEIFTKENLAYAREHYLDDVGLDNCMKHFLQAITEETEARFLSLINNSGV